MKTWLPFKTFTTHDGLKIRYGIWPCAPNAYRGKVILLSGRSEFLEKYSETIHELNQRGLTVYSFDWRGQGLSQRMLSDRRKGFVHSYDDYMKDLKQFIDEFVTPGKGQPMMVLAHSMGGHVALRFFHDSPGVIDKAVLISPLIDIAGSRLMRIIIRSAARLASAAGFQAQSAAKSAWDFTMHGKGFEQNRLTHDAGRYNRVRNLLLENPDLGIESVTFGWLHATFASIDRIFSKGFAEKIRLPILVVTAGGDKVVSIQAQEDICKRIRSARRIEIPGARHEILIETDSIRRAFWRAFDQFSNANLKT
jgi:lysophospholipase